MQQKAQKDWKDKVESRFKKGIAPNLSKTAFLEYLRVEPLPPLEDIALSEDAFMQEYVMPLNQKIAGEFLRQVREDAPFYANGKRLAEQGKDYVRVLYVPAIALSISLMIVVLTIGRNVVNLACRIKARQHNSRLRPLYWGVFLAMALLLPYAWPNSYTASQAYQKYYSLAKASAPVSARVLDWVVHVQPAVYRAGRYLEKMLP